MPAPRVIYEPKPGSPIEVDRPFYDRLAQRTEARTAVERFVVPKRSGQAWPVRAGQLFRIVAVEGPQVADLNVWNLGNPRERFWAARTKMLNGEDFDLCCHSNLVRAVAPYRLTELDVHDVLNVFQVTGLTTDDRYFVKASPAKKGDFIEFFAEIDVLCAISTCPHGDLSVQMWGEEAGDPLSTCRPLGVEIWQPDPALLDGWRPPEVASYRGDHGLRRG